MMVTGLVRILGGALGLLFVPTRAVALLRLDRKYLPKLG
jgi:hypothetical protein